MAESDVGSITARLRIDTAEWTRGLQQATQQLQGFARIVEQISEQVRQFGQAFQQAMGQQQRGLTAVGQAANGTRQSFQQFNQQLNATQQNFTQNISVAQQFNTQLTQVNTTLGQLRQQSGGASSGLQQVFQIAGGIGLATSIQGIVSSLKDFATETVQVATRLEQLRASFSAIGGSTAIGQQQFQQLFEMGQRLGVAFEPLAQGWRRLTAAASQTNLPLADQQRLLQAVATEGRRVGASNEELSRVFLALGQVASKGTLQMEEMRQQLGEALPTALGSLARGMGRTTDDLIKLIETGTIRFPTFARALTRGLEDIQSTARGMADISQQAFNRLGNALTAFKDAIGQNVLPELVRLAGVAQNILETATNILNITGGRGGGGAQGPTLGELGFTADQQREAARLQRLIELYTRQAGQGTPEMQQQRAEMVARAREQLEQLTQSVRTTEDQAAAQAKVTAETNKTTTQLELQKDFVADLRKQLDDVSKAQAAFRKEAALDPGRLGRMGGTPEEAVTFLRERQRAMDQPLEKLVQAAANPPPGVTLPPELRKEIAALSAEYGKLGTQIDDVREKEREREREARRIEQQTQRAIQQEIALTNQLEQVKGFVARSEESTAEQARTRVLQEGARMQAMVDQALRQFEQSAPLRARAPELQQQFQAMRDTLGQAIDTKALRAFNDAIERDAVEPLRRLAAAYGMTKEARDTDTASKLEAMAQDTIYAEETRQLAQAIRDSAKMLEQVPQLRQEAARSARLFETGRDLREAMENRLEQLQQAQSQGGMFGESRESLALAQRARRAEVAPEDQARIQQLQEQIRTQEHLNYAIGLFEQFAGNVGTAWTQALSSIAEGTMRVSDAFKAMAKSILQSMAQIASQEAFRALIRIGAGLITGAFTGTAGNAVAMEPAGAVGAGINPRLFQGGGIITKPTLAMMGEGPSYTKPEIVMNRPQMEGLMASMARGGSSTGGQSGSGNQIAIINVANQEQAEREAAAQRAMGRDVVINHVLGDLRQGSASQIGRMMRLSQQ